MVKGEYKMIDEFMPYFMTNKEWYYYDEVEEMFKLTDKAPPEAVKSYEEFYAEEEQEPEI
jgi:hypothetical protein